MKLGWLVVAAIVPVLGCSSSPEIKVRKTAFLLPAGWSKGESDDKSVTLGVPSGWRQGVDRTFDPKDMASMLPSSTDSSGASGEQSDTQKAIEGMAQEADQKASAQEKADLEKLKEKGIIVNVISGGKPTIGEERTRFYVKKESQGGNWTWEDAEKSERGQYKNKPKATKVNLPGGEAIRMQDSWQLVDGSNYTIVSYVIPNGKDLYHLRFVTVESADIVTGIEKQVAESLRVN